MSIHQKIAAVAILISLILFILNGESFALALVSIFSIGLYAFTLFIERKIDSDVVELKEQMRKLSDRVEAVTLRQGFGR